MQSTGSSKKTKAGLSRFSSWIRFAISFSLLFFILRSLDLNQLVSIFKNITIKYVIAVFAIDIGLRLFVSYRWYVLLNRTHPTFGLGEATRITFVSNFIGQFFPSWIGIEAMRIYGMAKKTSDLSGSFISVFIDRILGIFSLLITVCIGLVFVPEGLHPNIKLTAWISSGLMLLMFILMFHRMPRKAIETLLPGRLKSLLGAKLTKLYQSIDEYKHYPWTLAWALILAIIFQFFRAIWAYVAALSLGIQPPLLHFFALFPIILFMMLLPISVAGIGVREFSLVYIFSKFGIMDEASALSVSIIIFASTLFSTLPGAFLYNKKRSVDSSSTK